MKRGVTLALGVGILLSTAVALMPIQVESDIIGVQAAYADATEVSVGTFEELLAAFDSTYESESGSLTISLAGNIEQGYGEGDYMGVNSGWTVTLNLAGHILTLRNDGPRGLQNHGTLTITGNGTITNTTDDTMNEAYGLVDNYGGTVVVENGTFIDYGQGGGAAFKNRNGTLNINGGTITAYATAGGNACVFSDGVLTIADGVELRNYATDETHSGSSGSWYGAYAMTVNTGTATIGTTTSENSVVVNGNRGAIAVNGGNVTINNGTYTSGKYYGIWITNNDGETNVAINGGEFNGKKYGLYAAVDDGHQDASDTDVKIYDGKFVGETKGAVALNNKGSERDWGLEIYHGEFSSLPAQGYLAEGKEVYDKGEDGPYFVDDDVALPAYPETVLLEVGESYEIPYNNIMWKYATVGIAPSGVVTPQNWTITGAETGEAIINVNLHDYYTTTGEGGEPSEASFGVKVWTIDVETDAEGEEEVTDDDAAMVEGYVTEQLRKYLDGEEVAGGFYIFGEYTPEYIKEQLAAGKKIVTVVERDNYYIETEEEEEMVREYFEGNIEDNDSIAGAFWSGIELHLTDGDSGDWIGQVTELPESMELTYELEDKYLEGIPEGYERKFYVVRAHYLGEDEDGNEILEFTRIPAELVGKILKFKNELFSEFAVVYQDVNVDTGEVKTPETGSFTKMNDKSGAKETKLGLGVVAIAMAMAGLWLMSEGFRMKKERANNN